MILLAIDPASSPRKRGFAWTDGGKSLAYGTPHGTPAWAVVEGQWENPIAGKRSLMTLSFYAGLLLGRADAARRAVIPVHVWKGALFGAGFANAPKDSFTANIRQLLERRGLPGHTSDDMIDAAGLAIACTSGKFLLDPYVVE